MANPPASPVAWTNVGQEAAPTAIAAPAPSALDESFTLRDIEAALKKITPSFLLLAAFSGAAFAVGSGLVGHYLFPNRRR